MPFLFLIQNGKVSFNGFSSSSIMNRSNAGVEKKTLDGCLVTANQ